MAWDTRIEQFLDANGVDYRREAALDLTKIDLRRSQQNQARLFRPLMPDAIDMYRLAYAGGVDLPAIVVYRTDEERDRYTLIDGNQRVQAALKAGLKQLNAYDVRTPDRRMIADLTWFINTTNGVQASLEERVQHARRRVEEFGSTVKDAAAKAMLSVGVLESRLRALRAAEAIERAGGDAAGIDTTKLDILGQIPDAKVQLATADLARALTIDELRAAVHTVTAERSEADRLAKVAELRETHADQLANSRQGRRRSPTPRRDALLRHIRAMRRMIAAHRTLDALELTSPEHVAALTAEWLQLQQAVQVLLEGANGHRSRRAS